ncbi:MAG: response regulator transcription factor [Acidobacteriota bacterium]
MKHCSVLICDDHSIYREGVKIILGREPDLKVIGQARDGSEAIHLADLFKPDVMLVDLFVPGVRALDVAHQVTENDKNIRVLVLGMYDDEETVLQCRDAGAAGYLLKDTRVLHLLFAIRHVINSDRYLSPALLRQMSQSTSNKKSSKERALDLQVLSSRQREILLLLAEGFTYKEIGARLHLSVRTVDTHKYNLMRKLNIESRAGLIRFAIRQQLIEA